MRGTRRTWPATLTSGRPSVGVLGLSASSLPPASERASAPGPRGSLRPDQALLRAGARRWASLRHATSRKMNSCVKGRPPTPRWGSRFLRSSAGLRAAARHVPESGLPTADARFGRGHDRSAHLRAAVDNPSRFASRRSGRAPARHPDAGSPRSRAGGDGHQEVVAPIKAPFGQVDVAPHAGERVAEDAMTYSWTSRPRTSRISAGRGAALVLVAQLSRERGPHSRGAEVPDRLPTIQGGRKGRLPIRPGPGATDSGVLAGSHRALGDGEPEKKGPRPRPGPSPTGRMVALPRHQGSRGRNTAGPDRFPRRDRRCATERPEVGCGRTGPLRPPAGSHRTRSRAGGRWRDRARSSGGADRCASPACGWSRPRCSPTPRAGGCRGAPPRPAPGTGT